jgi:hypothetical protein
VQCSVGGLWGLGFSPSSSVCASARACAREENSEAVFLIGDGELGCRRGGAEELHIGGAASSSSAVAASTATSNVSAIGHLWLSGRHAFTRAEAKCGAIIRSNANPERRNSIVC